MQLGMIGLGRMGANIVPILKTVAPSKGDIEITPRRDRLSPKAEEGYFRCGSAGTDHFVKMVYNSIEYALIQVYAERFDTFRNANSKTLPEDQRYKFGGHVEKKA